MQTGGDEGTVTGAFFGAVHEAMGGVLEREDLTAAFAGRGDCRAGKEAALSLQAYYDTIAEGCRGSKRLPFCGVVERYTLFRVSGGLQGRTVAAGCVPCLTVKKGDVAYGTDFVVEAWRAGCGGANGPQVLGRCLAGRAVGGVRA